MLLIKLIAKDILKKLNTNYGKFLMSFDCFEISKYFQNINFKIYHFPFLTLRS